MAHDPVVFISSTSDDLKDHREQAAIAAHASGFSPRTMEYFPAAGHAPSPQACREKVDEAEVKEVLSFLVDPNHNWPTDLREDYRLVKERSKPHILEEVNRNEAHLAEFKDKLSGYFRSTFTKGRFCPTTGQLGSGEASGWASRPEQCPQTAF